jgi:hypothetical protein
MKRYFITKPVKGGYSYYDIRDRNGKYPNFSIASFSIRFPHVRRIIKNLCEELNKDA